MPTPDAPIDPVDAIATALARLRGRRMPRPPWEGGSGGDGPPWMRGGPHSGHSHGGPHAGPPWLGGGRGRFAGPARLRLLEALAGASHPLSVSEVADAVGVDQPRASRLVQQSVEMGLVRREADPDDARRTRIVLTEQGSGLVRGFRGERQVAVATALEAFSNEERVDLARLLTKLARAWPQG